MLALSRKPNYNVHVLTRDPHSTNAKYLQSLPNVVLRISVSESESDLRAAFTNITHAYINLNSFAFGIKNETYWGIPDLSNRPSERSQAFYLIQSG